MRPRFAQANNPLGTPNLWRAWEAKHRGFTGLFCANFRGTSRDYSHFFTQLPSPLRSFAADLLPSSASLRLCGYLYPTEPSTISDAGYQPLTSNQAGKRGKRRFGASSLRGKRWEEPVAEVGKGGLLRRFPQPSTPILHHSHTPFPTHSISDAPQFPSWFQAPRGTLGSEKIRFAGNTRN